MNEGIHHRKSGSDSPDVEKAGETSSHEFPDTHTHIRGIETSAETSLHRGLKSRHITMIAIGGALGTGLIIGTGKALAQAGPGSLFISYTFMGALVFVVMAAMGEMAAWIPLSSGFAGYASRYCHPSLGFTLGWTYWFKYIIVTPNQLTAAAIAIQFWVDREDVNPGVFIAIFLVLIICINYFGGIKFFGEFEFWLSSFKVITIVGIILFSLCIALGAGPAHRAKGFVPGFYTWQNPGAFAELYADGALGKFLGFWSVMVNATFAYLGTELVGVTAAEAASRKSIPKAIKLTFYRILFFYILSVLLVGMIVPYNHPELAFANKNSGNANASPFVVAAEIAGVEVLPHILNVCICLFVFSASNSDLYIASRTLYGLASDEAAPAIFRKTDNRGVPWPSLAVCSCIALLAFMNVADDSKVVFGYFVNLTTIFGILTWIFILITHLFFVKARQAQGIPEDDFKYRSPVGFWGSAIALFFCILVAFTKNFGAFVHSPDTYGNFDYKTFITGYLGIPLAFILFFGHKFWTGSKRIKALEVDFYTGKDIIEKQFDDYDALEREKAANANAGMSKFYYKYIAWLF